MNCPYCDKRIDGTTGLQELQAFQEHLNHCPKKPVCLTQEVVMGEHGGRMRVVRRPFDMNDALEIRAKSGQ
jgi:hypothetical protein